MKTMITKINSIIGISNKNLSNAILDFTAGISELNRQEFFDQLPKDVKYLLFIVYQNNEYYSIKQGEEVRVSLQSNLGEQKHYSSYIGKFFHYNEGLLILKRKSNE